MKCGHIEKKSSRHTCSKCGGDPLIRKYVADPNLEPSILDHPDYVLNADLKRHWENEK